jgi:hypothetical protein
MAVTNYGYLGSKYARLIPVNPVDIIEPIIPSKDMNCCSDFVWRVLADANSNDEFKNDKNTFYWWFNAESITFADLTLVNNLGDEYLLNSNTDYGTPKDYGFYTNAQNEVFVGYEIDWKKVIDNLGEAIYYIKCDTETIFGDKITLYSRNYCLKQYSADRADKTVRVEYWLNGILGISENDSKIKDFGELNIYNSHRFDGYFIYSESQYKDDYIIYNNGQRKYVEDEQEPEYTLSLKPIPAFKHDILRTDILQADEIQITDYNSRNIQEYIKKKVKKSGSYNPKYYPMQSKLASVELKFKQEFNNLRKFRY